MYYISTRDKTVRRSSAEVIKQGISAEGGLFVPIKFPIFSTEEIMRFSDLDYADRAARIFSFFLPDFSETELKFISKQAYNKDNFSTEGIAPITILTNDIFCLELWHGPTCAFKDFALQILPKFLASALAKTGDNNEIVILVATSGDTGKAALEGFKDIEKTRIIVFYPEKGVSETQRLQMVSQEGKNVHVVAVEGNFDDAQSAVKEIFNDSLLKEQLLTRDISFSSANSINWGRLLPQIVYYFSSYVDLVKKNYLKPGEDLNIVVPTGNFGNILAAYYSKLMGLPIGKLICASNSNKILADFLKTGIYDSDRSFHTTISPSMDILISSNLERLLFEISGRDDHKVSCWMSNLKENNNFDIGSDFLSELKNSFWGGWADEEKTKKAIKEVFDKFGYTMDPHTAVAKSVLDDYREYSNDGRKCLLVSTASPFKFSKDVLDAIQGYTDDSVSEFGLLRKLSDLSKMRIPSSLESLENKEVFHSTKCNKKDLKNTILKILSEIV